jgi:hypothetical protein
LFVFPEGNEVSKTMTSDFETETGAESPTKTTTDIGMGGDILHSETKLAAGRQNAVIACHSLRAEETVPFDVSALYCYLVEQAEQRHLLAAVEDTVWLFEAEFASNGAIPESVVNVVADRVQQTGMNAASPYDDLRLDAVITVFLDEYSQAFAAAPDKLPDPRGVPTRPMRSYCVDITEQLCQRLRSLLRGSKRP